MRYVEEVERESEPDVKGATNTTPIASPSPTSRDDGALKEPKISQAFGEADRGG